MRWPCARRSPAFRGRLVWLSAYGVILPEMRRPTGAVGAAARRGAAAAGTDAAAGLADLLAGLRVPLVAVATARVGWLDAVPVPQPQRTPGASAITTTTPTWRTRCDVLAGLSRLCDAPCPTHHLAGLMSRCVTSESLSAIVAISVRELPSP